MGRPGDGGRVVRLADVLRDHRRRTGLTQRELAAKASLSLAALRDLEQGRRSRPRSASLAALAKALGLDPGQTAELASLADQPTRRAPGPDPPPAGTWARADAMRRGLWLAVLGPMEAWLDGTPVPIGPPGRRAVLGLLAMDPGTVVRRDSVIDTLWGPRAPSTGVSLVQAHVSRLRKLLRPCQKEPWADDEIIASVGGGYRLQLETEQLDLLVFRALATEAEAAHAAGDDPTACDLYEQTMELWRGDPLADVDVLHDQPSVVEQRRQLADVLLRYSELACGLGFHDRVLSRLHALAAAEPLNERVHARLMIALAGAGQQVAALEVYDDIRARLDHEFAIYPSEELVQAHLRVLRQELPLIVRPSFSGPPPGHVVPRQLPAAARYFVGRNRERAVLSHLVDQGSREAGEVMIAALTGMAGIGKTALAVSWAHEVADKFPDGQLFVDLHGFSYSDSVLPPAEALRSVLTALGLASTLIPADTAGRAAMYRSMLVGRRVLIVLDNARDAEQVRPLLPGSPGCLVLVTSRHRLTGLAAACGAFLLPMGGLYDGEAYNLLAKLLGAERMIAESEAIGELSTLCARLPLALCNAAARAAASPGLPVATLVAEMRDERFRLDALETGEPATSLRGLFSLSQTRLSAPARRMFEVLGIHPGPEITVAAAAAVAGLKRTRAQTALAELCDEHLLTERARGRYACHELLRAYAAEAAARTPIREDGWRASVYRMLDYYLHTASAAAILLFPYLAPRMLEPSRRGAHPEHFPSVRQATQWARSESRVLLAVIDQAVEGGYCPHAWELPWVAGWLLTDEAGWRKLAAAQEDALAIAENVGDLAGAALAHHHLGWLSFWLGEDAQVWRHLGQSAEIANQLSEVFPAPVGLAIQNLRVQGDVPEALVDAGRALGFFRPAGDGVSAIVLARADGMPDPRDRS